MDVRQNAKVYSEVMNELMARLRLYDPSETLTEEQLQDLLVETMDLPCESSGTTAQK